MQPKADHQWTKILLTNFQWIGAYVIEKVSPNNNHLVRKIETNKTQVLHRMRMRQFTPSQPPPDLRITPRESKPDPEVSLKHDDLCARAWEFQYEKPFSDAENNIATPSNSSEVPVQYDLSTEETWNTPRTAQECSREVFPQTEQLCDVKDTYPYMEPDVETSPEQPNNRSTKPRS